MLQKMPFNFPQPSVRVTGGPNPRERRQPQGLGLRLRRRRNLLAGLPGPVIRRRPCPPAYQWWNGPNPAEVPGLKGSECHRSLSGERSRRSHGSDRHHDSPRSHHSARHDSGRRESGERSRPRSSGGSRSRRQAGSTDAPGSSRVSLRATEVRPSGSSTHHHHHKTSVDRS